MKKSTILRLSLAVAMMFSVSINADAQLGKLKGLADKAKKTVSQDADQSASEKRVMDDYVQSHPREQEKRAAEAAGGMDKYLGLDKTENGRILWKYASMEPAEYRKTMQIHNAFDAANQVVQVLRYVKGNTETFEMYHQQSVVLNVFNTRIPNNLQAAAKASKNGAAVSAKDLAAIKSEAARVKKMYMESSGATEKSADQTKAEANDAYVQDIINKNYLLDNLTDKNRQAKAVADYKAKVNAKIKQQLAPTKILGTYSTTVSWMSLPLQNYPELKEKYDNVQEMQFKTFYQKGGKYYVVKSAFRQSVPKGENNKSGAKPQAFYWPGIETPVEVPASKIQGKF